jgi:hypothetical protein
MKPKINRMNPGYSSVETKKLLLQFIMEDIRFMKESRKLNELIHLGKETDRIQHLLTEFLDASMIETFSLEGHISN